MYFKRFVTMEQEMISSSSMTMTKSEDSNTNNSNSPPQKSKPSSRYKGVVPQANGNWGAQIYADHHRIWLGTFKTEDLAAAAYDSAAIKLRHGNSADPNRNFPSNDFTIYERAFQEDYTMEQVLNMIKDGSYQTKFFEFLSISPGNGSQPIPRNSSETESGGYISKELFRKELTPSDVGKLNRLVIPKRHAVKFFKPKDLMEQFGVGQGTVDDGDLELPFYDKSMKRWKFRYCYWQSSSSYVFTRGWNGFVKEKDLKAKDVVVFYKCDMRDTDNNNNNNKNDAVSKFYMIDVEGFNASEGSSSRKRDFGGEIVNDEELQSKKAKVDEATIENANKGFRLFGVEIVPENCNVER